MAPPASERTAHAFRGLPALLAPFPGRMEFALRLALICALTTLVAEIYQTPEPALTVYVAFFLIKPDRATSIVLSVVFVLLITLVIGAVILVAMRVIDQPLWRVTAMALISFGLLFAASASKLKPIAGIVALIAAYALDLLGQVQTGETATRALLYAWLFVGIPAGVSIVVNLVLGPSPRRRAQRALADRLHLAAAMLGAPDERDRKAFEECLREGPGEIPAWLRLAGAEKTSSSHDLAALGQATQSSAVILSVVDLIAREPDRLAPPEVRNAIALTLDGMAAILRNGGYPVDVVLDYPEDELAISPLAAAALVELRAAVAAFADPPPPEAPAAPEAKPPGGFFLADAFTNPAHVQYALKTTAAAMFCYVAYELLDWPGIHTCLITCYIVSLGTTAETFEKLTLRILGCLVGAAVGIAAIVFLMPNVTSIGALMAIVFGATLVTGWIAAGSPRVSYVGFQLAFAFFLCVIQGSSPGFDMTIARDRVIGILFGDLVVAAIFTLVWPVSVSGRIDPAIAALLRRLAALAAAASRPGRWALVAQTQAELGAIEQDLDLTRYEPAAVRPEPGWLDRRREVAHALAALQAPLLISADQNPARRGDVVRRLGWLTGDFGAPASAVSTPVDRLAAAGAPDALIEAPLARLEQLIHASSDSFEERRVDHAPA